MKFLMWFLIFVFVVATIGSVTGCGTITVKDIDPATGKVVKETTTTGTGVIITSTQNKSIYAFRSGWFFLAEVTPGSPDNPMAHFTLDGGCLDSGILLLHKDQQNIQGVADIIKAGRSSFTVSATGANTNPQSTSSTPSTTSTTSPAAPVLPGSPSVPSVPSVASVKSVAPK